MSKIYAVTGHRPQSIPSYNFDRLVQLATAALMFHEVPKVITGMALGWDIAIAQAAHNLQIPYIAAIPFRYQDCKWKEEDRQLWERLSFLAVEVIHVDAVKGYTTKNCEVGAYHVSKMHKRNKYMIDNCTNVLALYNGQQSGGTYKCVEYANSKNVPVANVWNSWLKYNRARANNKMSKQYILYRAENNEEKYLYDHHSIFGISFTYDIQDSLKFSLEEAQKLANEENLLIKQYLE